MRWGTPPCDRELIRQFISIDLATEVDVSALLASRECVRIMTFVGPRDHGSQVIVAVDVLQASNHKGQFGTDGGAGT